MKLALATAAVLALAATAVGAQTTPPPANTNPAMVQPGTYKVDPSHSRVIFSVLHMGFTNYAGVFATAEGTAMFDPKNATLDKLDVSVPVTSVITGNARLDGELKSKDWLDADQFPMLKFHATKVTPAGPGKADVMGDLTMHGVTLPMTLHATFVGSGANAMSKAYTVGFQATGVVKRSAFGVKTYVPLVGDDVELSIAGAFEKTS